MAATIQIKRGKAAFLPALLAAEFGFTLDTKKLYIGTGSTNEGVAMQRDLDALQEAIAPDVAELSARVDSLWDAVFTDVTKNPFAIVLASLDGVTVTAGNYHEALDRLEC